MLDVFQINSVLISCGVAAISVNFEDYGYTVNPKEERIKLE